MSRPRIAIIFVTISLTFFCDQVRSDPPGAGANGGESDSWDALINKPKPTPAGGKNPPAGQPTPVQATDVGSPNGPAAQPAQQLGLGSNSGPGSNTAVGRMNSTAGRLGSGQNDPFNKGLRTQYQNQIANGFQTYQSVAKALKGKNISKEEAKKLQRMVAGMVDLNLAPSTTRKRRSVRIETPAPISVPALAVAKRAAQARRQNRNNLQLQNLDEFKVFDNDGNEIPVLVDNRELTEGGTQQAVVESAHLDDKFQAIAAGPSTASVSVANYNNVAATSNVAPNQELENNVEVNAEPQRGAAVAAVKFNDEEAGEGELTAEDILNALLNPDEELGEEEKGLQKNQAGIQAGIGDGANTVEPDELGREVPLVLRSGKLKKHAKRGLSGKRDKPLPIGTRTGNGRDIDSEDGLLFSAGKKFPVLRGIYEKATGNPVALQFMFWLAAFLGLTFIMRLFRNPSPVRETNAYFAVAQAGQDSHHPEELEISFTQPQKVQPKVSKATPVYEVDPDLGELREDGEFDTGSFDILENTAHSITKINTITQDITGTLAPWTPPAQMALEPNRIYIKLNEPTGKWYLIRTDIYAKIGETLGEIFPGTVVEGKVLGPKFTAKRYKLSRKGAWLPTQERVQFVVSVVKQGQGPDWWS